jgi:putative transposase
MPDPPPDASLANLPAAARQQALERFKLIRPFLEEGVQLTEIAHQHAIPIRTARRWVQRYRESGLAGLLRKPRADKGIHRGLPSSLQALVEALALDVPRRSIATIHRTVSAIANDQDTDPPSYHTVYTLVKQIDPALVTLAHQGAEAYRNTYELLYRREADAPNAIWQADHTLLDILLLDDKGQPAKPWLTVIMDDYSRAIAGYSLSFSSPTALQTALALHQAIWRKAEAAWQVCGIPDVLYTDHGSAFTSQHIEQVCAALQLRLIFSQVGKPRGRGRIERFFETVAQRLLADLPGYAPAGTPNVKAVLTLHQLDQVLAQFIVHHYQVTPHSATGVAPLARWSEQGFLPQLPESLEQLDLLLLTVAKPRGVHRDGIRFQSLRYIDPTLAAYVGESVTIRYNPRDMAEIRVYFQGHFLCRAICQELAGETVSLKDITRARNQRKRELQQVIAKRRSLVDQVLTKPTPVGVAASTTTTSSEASPSRPKLKRYEQD